MKKLITINVLVWVLCGVFTYNAQAETVQEWAQKQLDSEPWTATTEQLFLSGAAMPDGKDKGTGQIKWLIRYTDAAMYDVNRGEALDTLYWIVMLTHAAYNLDRGKCIDFWKRNIDFHSHRMTEYQYDKMMVAAAVTIQEADENAKKVGLPY
jgi:hypothetical protein